MMTDLSFVSMKLMTRFLMVFVALANLIEGVVLGEKWYTILGFVVVTTAVVPFVGKLAERNPLD